VDSSSLDSEWERLLMNWGVDLPLRGVVKEIGLLPSIARGENGAPITFGLVQNNKPFY